MLSKPGVKPPAPRILVAEDDHEMRRLVADGLRKDGYEVEEEADGQHALLRLLTIPAPFDLIVTDVRMPGCSGLSILEALRAAGSKTPVILMSAFGDDEIRERAETLGAVFVGKPLAMAKLRVTAGQLVARPSPESNGHGV
jgi:two-component system, response regulator, stage 0 sporulation protein F